MSDDRRLAVFVAVVLSGLGIFSIAGSSKLSGPVLFALSGTHGVHRDDFVVLVLWLAGMSACLTLWRRNR